MLMGGGVTSAGDGGAAGHAQEGPRRGAHQVDSQPAVHAVLAGEQHEERHDRTARPRRAQPPPQNVSCQ